MLASSAVLTPEPEQLAHWTFRLLEVEAMTLPEPSTICVFWLPPVWLAEVAAPVGNVIDPLTVTGSWPEGFGFAQYVLAELQIVTGDPANAAEALRANIDAPNRIVFMFGS